MKHKISLQLFLLILIGMLSYSCQNETNLIDNSNSLSEIDVSLYQDYSKTLKTRFLKTLKKKSSVSIENVVIERLRDDYGNDAVISYEKNIKKVDYSTDVSQKLKSMDLSGGEMDAKTAEDVVSVMFDGVQHHTSDKVEGELYLELDNFGKYASLEVINNRVYSDEIIKNRLHDKINQIKGSVLKKVGAVDKKNEDKIDYSINFLSKNVDFIVDENGSKQYHSKKGVLSSWFSRLVRDVVTVIIQIVVAAAIVAATVLVMVVASGDGPLLPALVAAIGIVKATQAIYFIDEEIEKLWERNDW